MSGFFFTELLLLHDCASPILEDSLLYMAGFRGFFIIILIYGENTEYICGI